MTEHSPIAGWRAALAGSQMLFVAFGALVLVPLLTGLDPSVAFFTAGLGTLLFQLVTRRQVPIFLASSFAFIAPIIYSSQTYGMAATMGGLMAAGVFYMLLAGLVQLRGASILYKLFPPVVVGPVIMVIGLGLAPVAVNMAMGKTGDGAAQLVAQGPALTVAFISLATTLLVACLGKGIFRLIPIMFGILAGYIASSFYGLLNHEVVANAPWFAIPAFRLPEFHWQAVLFMIPVAIAPAIEHIGDMLAISNVTGKDYLKKPGLHRTLLGDGLATSAAALFGGPPNTTYSEVTGAVMLTKAYNPVIMTWAAVCAIGLAFIGKIGAILQSIPVPVMGGIMMLLFGSIAVVGLNTLVKAQVNLSHARNLAIVSLVLVIGIGGMALNVADFTFKGVSLCAVVAIVLNLILPHEKGEDRYQGQQPQAPSKH